MKQKIGILLFMLAAACGKQSGEGGLTPGAPAPITEQQQAGEQRGFVQTVPNILFEGATEFNDDQPQLFQARILDLQNLLPPFEVLIESSNLNILAITIVGSDSPTAAINPNDRRLIRINDVIPTPFAIQFVATPSPVIDRTPVELTLRVIDSQTATVFFNTPPFPITVVPAPIVAEPAPAPAPIVEEPAPIVAEPAPAPIVEEPAPIVAEPAPAPVITEPAPEPAPIVAEPAPAPVVTEGIISTIAGNGVEGFNGDGTDATIQSLAFPKKVAVNNFTPSGSLDGAANIVVVADTTNHRVRRLQRKLRNDGTSSWDIITIAGSATTSFSGGGDGGLATAATLSSPEGVAFDGAGNLFISDSSTHTIRKVGVGGIITTVAGIPGTGGLANSGFSGDGGPATAALLSAPKGIALDLAGNLFIADSGNNRIRKVDRLGIIKTVAGSGLPVLFGGDGLVATAAPLSGPEGVAVDSAGNLFIADRLHHRIRKVDTLGIITTVAGDGVPMFQNGGGIATSASLNNPEDVAVDPSGNLFIADTVNAQIRKVDTNGIITTINARLNFPFGVAVDAAGNLFIADTFNHRIIKVSGPASEPVVAAPSPAPTITAETKLISIASDGTKGTNDSFSSSISGDGRFVAFISLATNLVPNDTNGRRDVFLHDTQTRETRRISVVSDGREGNDGISGCSFPFLSAGGRFVAFASDFSNLVPNDTNDRSDIFVHDTQTRETRRVSVASDGTQGINGAFAASFSADGRFVAFDSLSFNLVPNDTNGAIDVFIHGPLF